MPTAQDFRLRAPACTDAIATCPGLSRMSENVHRTTPQPSARRRSSRDFSRIRSSLLWYLMAPSASPTPQFGPPHVGVADQAVCIMERSLLQDGFGDPSSTRASRENVSRTVWAPDLARVNASSVSARRPRCRHGRSGLGVRRAWRPAKAQRRRRRSATGWSHVGPAEGRRGPGSRGTPPITSVERGSTGPVVTSASGMTSR